MHAEIAIDLTQRSRSEFISDPENFAWVAQINRTKKGKGSRHTPCAVTEMQKTALFFGGRHTECACYFERKKPGFLEKPGFWSHAFSERPRFSFRKAGLLV